MLIGAEPGLRNAEPRSTEGGEEGGSCTSRIHEIVIGF